MDLTSQITIRVDDSISDKQNKSLLLCYYPCIEKDAYLLYQLLMASDGYQDSLKAYLEIMMMNQQGFINAKNKLEQFGLIYSYFNSDKNHYLIDVRMPYDIKGFLTHEVLGRYLIYKKGRNYYEKMITIYKKHQIKQEGYENITSGFGNLLDEMWDISNEVSYQNSKKNIKKQYRFPINHFLANTSETIFPKRARSEEVIVLIAEMADIYGINEKRMKQIVSKSIDVTSGYLKKDEFKRRARNEYGSFKHSKEHEYDVSPIQYLQSKQVGVPLSDSDKYIIERLLRDFGLKEEVVCVLIDYCLEKCNQQLNRRFCDKVATSWVRNNIDTYQKALDMIKNFNQRNNSNKATIEKHYDINDEDSSDNQVISDEQWQKMIDQL